MCGSMVDIQSPTAEIRRANKKKKKELEMWANAQRDGRPAEYRWRPLFNTAKFGWLVAWSSGKTSVFGRRAFAVLFAGKTV